MFDRIEKIDFFAVLPAGFFVFVVLFIDYQAFLSPDAFLGKSIWNPVLNLAEAVGSKPVTLALILFVCYLLGSSLRAFPVKWVERITPPFRIEFPYPEKLNNVIKELASNCKACDFELERSPIINNNVEMTVFNYWKDTLCIGAHDAFAYYQTFEARTRFFAGMFWSGCIGIVGGTAVLFFRGVSELPDKYIPFVLSVILVAIFGGQFRRVRVQEARVLITLFAVHMQKRKISQQDGPPDQRESAPASR